MNARLVMMEGLPGAGKSTLAEGIAPSLGPRADIVRAHERAGWTVVHLDSAKRVEAVLETTLLVLR